MLANKALSAAPAAVPLYIEDTFSTYLYTGNGSTQTITNNIDLSGEGGLVWLKKRNTATNSNHQLTDTVRGAQKPIISNSTGAELTASDTYLSSFSSSGFSLGSDANYNNSSDTYVSWTFRKAEKFFDVVTYTGNGSNRTISHNLGSTPGCIMVKRTDDVNEWVVYHRSLGATKALTLNTTDASYTNNTRWNDTEPTSTNFTVGTNAGVNASGGTYVAYLFAHDAGGFGEDSDQSVIKCGSITGTGFAVSVELGWEPQWLLTKSSTSTQSWCMYDIMRGQPVGSAAQEMYPNSSAAEGAGFTVFPTATGFSATVSSQTYIYIAIRRGPMKTPEAGTEVYNADTFGGGPPGFQSGFVTDLAFYKDKDSSPSDWFVSSRLTSGQFLKFNTTGAESASASYDFDYMNGWFDSSSSDSTIQSWMFRRAPGFFDVVCYTGTGSARTITHNLGAVPELMIVKSRSSSSYVWAVYNSSVGATKYLRLNSNIGSSTESNIWNDTAPTSSVFTVGTGATVNENSGTYVAYLFASVTGVSKVGTYTGNGSSQTINCGFTAGARLVLVKRTDSTGDWLIADSARGIVSGNDPYLELNTTNAEVTSEDWLDTDSTGFVVNEVSGSNANTNSATYIYLAIS